jgi:hypothetical protein
VAGQIATKILQADIETAECLRQLRLIIIVGKPIGLRNSGFVPQSGAEIKMGINSGI